MRIRSTAAAGLLVTAALSFGFTGTAGAADRDCKDFPDQVAAQAALLPGDPERLDANNNGVACEDYDYSSVAPASAPAATGTTTAPQVATVPSGAVAAGDGSSSGEGSVLPYAVGGVALIGAAGAAAAARRARSTV